MIMTSKDTDKNRLIFENIYSGDYDIQRDAIHGDPENSTA